MTPDHIRQEAELLVVTSGGRLSLEAALAHVETERELQRAALGAGVCTCADQPPPPPQPLIERFKSWIFG